MQKVQGGVTIQYVYSGGPAPIAEKNVSTGEWTNFIQANGETWAMKTASGTKYLHKDQIGSVIALSDGSGTVTDTFQYDPWGNTVSRTGTTQTDYGFVGGHGVRTLSNGQMVMGRRIYDPQIGRFTTRDPIGYAGEDINFYRSNRNNPIRFYDTNGDIPLDTIWDAANIIYDLYTGDSVSLAADTAALFIPYIPAGTSKLMKAGKAAKGAISSGTEFKKGARVGEVLVGVDPKTLKPVKDLNTLDPKRVQDAVQYAGDKSIKASADGRIQDGHHRIKDAIDRGKAIDVEVVP